MEKIIVNGGNKLEGKVKISGAKNAAVGLVPAAIISDEVCVIENLPYISDIIKFSEILNNMGIRSEFLDNHTLKIHSNIKPTSKPKYELVNKLRASYYLLGALLTKYKEAEVALPGGCNFGGRPIDQHIKGFEALGAEVKIENGVVKLKAEELKGADIYLDMVSVGATINVMLAAVKAKGMTTIENAAREPHVVDIANFLNSMGANVKGAGTDVIKIKGVEKLNGSTYETVPDQIEAGTYMIAAAITEGDLEITNVIPKHLESITYKLKEMGIEVIEDGDKIRVKGERPYKPVNVKTRPYPGFPTDMQPQMTTLLSTVKGNSIMRENVYDNRMQYVSELNRFGVNVSAEGRVAVINGVDSLSGTEARCTDLRGGISMVLAGLVAEGTTKVTNIKHVKRGYEKLIEKFTNIGADIKIIEETE